MSDTPSIDCDSEEEDASSQLLAELADDILDPALSGGAGVDARTGLELLLAELERAPHCRGSERVEAIPSVAK